MCKPAQEAQRGREFTDVVWVRLHEWGSCAQVVYNPVEDTDALSKPQGSKRKREGAGRGVDSQFTWEPGHKPRQDQVESIPVACSMFKFIEVLNQQKKQRQKTLGRGCSIGRWCIPQPGIGRPPNPSNKKPISLVSGLKRVPGSRKLRQLSINQQEYSV